jgi:hypothetical protein
MNLTNSTLDFPLVICMIEPGRYPSNEALEVILFNLAPDLICVCVFIYIYIYIFFKNKFAVHWRI